MEDRVRRHRRKKEEEESKVFTKEPVLAVERWQENTGWKPRTTDPGHSKRIAVDRRDESFPWLIKERKAPCHKSGKESQKKGGICVDTNSRVKVSKLIGCNNPE